MKSVPDILLDSKEGIVQVKGISFPQYPLKYYKPVFNWVDQYFKNPNNETVFIFNFTYLNTGTFKVLYKLFIKLDSLYKNGNLFKIQWIFNEEDDKILDAGMLYAESFDFPFIFCKVQDDTE